MSSLPWDGNGSVDGAKSGCNLRKGGVGTLYRENDYTMINYTMTFGIVVLQCSLLLDL